MLELRMTTNLEESLPRELSFNFDELKAELTAQLERYNGLIITEDTIKAGKDDRAKLNKLKTAIDTRRKEIKKQWNEPYTNFEGKIKEVLALIEAPIQAIDRQLNTYEEQRKAEKRDEIYDRYHEIVPEDIKGILLFERIFDSRWLNKGVSIEEVEEAITSQTIRVQNDLLALKEIEPEHAAAVRTEYYKTLDLGAAMRHLTTLRETAEAMKREAPTTNPPEPEKPAEPAQEPQRAPAPAEDKTYTYRLELGMTQKQAAELKQYLVANGIKFSQIR